MKKTVFCLLAFCYVGHSFAQLDSTALDKVFGKKGSIMGTVYKITFARSDLKVKVNDFAVSPGLALTSWIGIISMGNQAMMMGDLVLLDEEVAPVVSKLVASNLSLTAMHNHLVNERPNIKYIHFSGSGDALQLAASIKSVLSVTGTPLTAPVAQGQTINPDWSKVEGILGTTGKRIGQLLQYSFPRNEKLTESGMEMPPAIGMATAINFQMEGDHAAMTGDFVLLADEVNPVIKALTANGIAVTAIHNHMLYDNPRLFMLHFWAVNDPEKLANGLKAALKKTNSK
ncbi:MAG TPA: DUF1259 domain-containing protein [Puia sp.]|nr:DUF1259 domain-containing protein [Puia sp.]